MATKFVKESNVRKYINERNRRCTKEFVSYLDSVVQDRIDKAMRVFNGHHKSVTPDLLKGIPSK